MATAAAPPHMLPANTAGNTSDEDNDEKVTTAVGRRRNLELKNLEWHSANYLREFMHKKGMPRDKVMLHNHLLPHKAELATLKTKKKHMIIKDDQWDLIYPMSGETDSDSFDIPLMRLLLKNKKICSLHQWEEAAVEECNNLRIKSNHHGKIITDADYNDCINRYKNWFSKMGMSRADWSVMRNSIIFNDVGSLMFHLTNPVSNFVGRKKQLKDLHTALQDYDVVVVKGLSGVGKSELIRKYCQENKKQYDENILFINAETEATLENFFLNFAKYISSTDTKQSVMIEVLISQVYNYLSTRRCLLVFDNADKSNVLDEFLPTMSSNNLRKIIITTQLHIWKKDFKQLELMPLEVSDGLEFLTKELGDGFNLKDCERLITVLSSLPLALQLASSFMQHADMSIHKFLKYHEKKFKELWSMVDESDIDGNAKTILTTWKMAFDHLTNPLSIKLLRMFSLMDGKRIDEKLLLSIEGVNELQLKNSLFHLKKYSLITVTDQFVNGKKRFIVKIHNLVQQVTRANLSNEEQKIVIDGFFQMCKRVTETIDNKTHQNFGDIWMHHVFRCVDQISIKIDPSHLISNVIKNTASAAINGGKLKSTISFIQSCKNLFTYQCKELTLTEALLLQENGKYEEAIEMYKEVLNLRVSVLGVEHPDTLSTKNNLAVSLRKQGKYEEAIEMYKEVLNSQVSVLGVDHPDTLSTKNNLAVSLLKQGKYEEAIEMYKEVLNSQVSVLGVEHPDTLSVKNNLANTLDDQGKYEEAIEMYKEVLNSRVSVLGVEHPDTLGTKNNLANTLRNQGKYEEAIEMYKEVLNSRVSVLGVEHPDTLRTKNNLCYVNKEKCERKPVETNE